MLSEGFTKSETVLKCPEHIKLYRDNKEQIAIDSEIIDTIKYLWENGVVTLGCCCGHGKDNPSIVIGEGTMPEAIEYIKELIKRVDNREWIIYQWRLTEV